MNCAYKTVSNEIFGRYLVAARDLRQGELILTERPLLVGPQITASLICFRCCTQITNNCVSCSSCKVAILCKTNCSGVLHDENECAAFQAQTSKQLNGQVFLQHPQLILPLRCLLLKNYDSYKWNKLLELESHLEARKSSYIWNLHKVQTSDVLLGLGLETDEELVQKICGILDVNSFEIRPSATTDQIDPKDCLRGLYLQAALMAHDCTANTHLAISDEFEMTIHAAVDIKCGDSIFFNYANVLMGTYERRKHLKQGKYFDCACARCSDATELGSNLSALLCPNCTTGLINPNKPLIATSGWICNQCNASFNFAAIKSNLKIQSAYSNVQEAEQLLAQLSLTLAPNHYLMMEVKQNIVSLLTAGMGDRDVFRRKIQLCEEIVDVLKILEPGISRLQAIAVYELQSAKLALANDEYNSKAINTNAFLTKLHDVELLLKTSIKYLLYEPKKSREGKLAQQALTELRVLKMTVEDITRILNTARKTSK